VNSHAVQIFVYYRIRAADAAPAIAAVAAFQASLCRSIPGLAGELSRRVDDGADLLTLMETYVHADAASPDWQHDIERLARKQLATWIVGERHVEVFVPCA
jgi:predicted metal-binding protein